MHKLRTFAMLALLVWAPALAQERLLIVTADDFLGELWRLKAFKDATGRPTTLLSLNEVLITFPGVDSAEQVKRCIEHYARTQEVEYVLLVGDVERFPVRWRWWGLPGQEGWAVSDLYYADLYDSGTLSFDDWDATDNGLYGEIEFSPDGNLNNDSIDFLPDVAVGRIPASSTAEVKAYVDKVIRYEIKATPEAAWFKRAALYTGTWLSSANSEMDVIGNGLSAGGFTLTKRYSDWIEPDNPQPPSGVPGVIWSDLNNGVGFVSYIGHGSPSCMSCLRVCTADLTNLHNDDMLPVVFASACDTGGLAWLARLGPYVDTAGGEHCGTAYGENLPVGAYPHAGVPRPACVQDDADDGRVTCSVGGTLSFDADCFAESILFGNPVGSGGAIAYFGERSGGQVTAVDLNRFFFQAWGRGRTILGDMWNYSIEEYSKKFNISQSGSWQRAPEQWRDGHTFDEPQKFLLFGDPSLHVGGAFGSGACGQLYDGFNAPLLAYSRLRIVCDTEVPYGRRLTVHPGASLLFEPGTHLLASGEWVDGLFLSGAQGLWTWLLSASTAEEPEKALIGVGVRGEVRMANGGAIRVH